MGQTPKSLMRQWLGRQLPEAKLAWLDGQLDKLVGNPADRDLYISLGMAPRKLGKDDLTLTDADLQAADQARTGWDPRDWSVDETARILMLCTLGAGDARFAERFRELCRTAEVAEAIALYRGLPLYPTPEALEAQAGEGLRTNMRAVFEAVAHRSPYPREVFDENRWNQMVLKALFIDSRLYPIQGLDERANPALAQIMCDYAHERWAAGRPVSPELWRCVGPFADTDALQDLARAAASEIKIERGAAALALTASPAKGAAEILGGMPELVSEIESGRLTWEALSQEL